MKQAGRCLALLLAAMICLTIPTAMAEEALALPIGNLLYDSAEELRGIAVLEDAVYLLSYTKLLRWRMGEAAVTELAAVKPFEINPSEMLSAVLLSDGQRLWRLEPGRGRLQQLIVAGDSYRAEAAITLDWRMFSDGLGRPQGALIHDGRLYLSAAEQRGSMRLISYALKQGAKPLRMKVLNLHALAPYGEGRLLALQYDQAAGERQAGLPVTLGVLDLKADHFKPLTEVALGSYPNMDSSALLSAQGAIYLASGDRLWRIGPDNRQEACAILLDANFVNKAGQSLFALQDKLLIAGRQQVLIRSGDPAALKQAGQLMINTDFMHLPRMKERVALSMGDTVLHYNPDKAEHSQQELASAFLLHEVASDVLVLDDHSFDLSALGKKGYLLDLSESTVIKAWVEGLDPRLASILWQDGRLVMIPVGVQMITPSAHRQALEALGLFVPADFFQLCDLVARYGSEEIQRQRPSALFQSSDYREDLIRFGVDLWLNAAHASGQTAQFEHPTFRRMMERVQQLNLPAKGQLGNPSTEYPLMALANTLQESPWSFREGDYERAFDFFAMSVEPGAAPAVTAHFRMLAINSQTRVPALALRYLEAVVRESSPEALALMQPAFEGPILNPDYAHDVAATRQRIMMFEDIAQSATDRRTRESYEQEAARERQLLDTASQSLQYLETAETVAKAHAIARHMQPWTGLRTAQLLALAENNLVGQYAKGVLSLDQFIQQADNKLRLVTLEYQ